MKVNSLVLSARMRDVEQVIKNAIFLENLAVDGKTSEEVISEAKRVLSLNDNDSVIASYEDKAKLLNLKSNLLTKIYSALNDAKDLGLHGSLEEVALNLAVELKQVYDLTDEDLFLKGE